MTEVLVVREPTAPTMFIRPETQDLDALDDFIREEESARGGIFPGETYSIKKSTLIRGFGDSKERVDERDISLILNIPNMWFGWQMFDRSQGRNGKMVYGPVARPLMGEKLTARDQLGHDNKDEWDEYNGRPMDPWQRYAAIPFRIDGETKVNTLLATSWSQIQEVRQMLKAYRNGYVKNIGKFPVVNLKAKSEPHWDDAQIRIETMEMEIVDWEMPIDADFPGVSEEQQPEQQQAARKEVPNDVKVETRARSSEGETDDAGTAAEASGESFGDVVTKIDAEDKVAAKSRRSGAKAEAEDGGESAASAEGNSVWGGRTGGRRRRAAAAA